MITSFINSETIPLLHLMSFTEDLSLSQYRLSYPRSFYVKFKLMPSAVMKKHVPK